MRHVVLLGWVAVLMPALAQTHVATTIGDLPVGFEPNVGQTDSLPLVCPARFMKTA